MIVTLVFMRICMPMLLPYCVCEDPLEQPARILVCFRNDDLSALSDVAHERRVMSIFDRFRVRQTVGVIPAVCIGDPRDPSGCLYLSLEANQEVVSLLRGWMADEKVEIAIHGFTHQANPAVTNLQRNEIAEFRGLAYKHQLRRIQAGVVILRNTLGIRPDIFIPPWNEWDKNTLLASAACGIHVISANMNYVPECDGLLPVNFNATLREFSKRVDAARPGTGTALIIVLYHSNKIQAPEDWELLEEVVGSAAKAEDIRIVTLGEVARNYPDLARNANAAARNVGAQHLDRNRDRGAAYLYRRMVGAFGIELEVDGLYQEARAAYLRGDYGHASSLSGAIDEHCSRIVLGARCGLALAGVIFGWSTLWIVSRVGCARVVGVLYCAIALGIVVGVGIGACWRATASVTRSEILASVGVVVASTLAGMCVSGTLGWLRRKTG